MKTAVFSTRPYVQQFFEEANAEHRHDLHFMDMRLSASSAPLAAEFPAVCIFVNDQADRDVLEILADGETRLLTLRSAGFNHVDIEAADELGLTVTRVPCYSPYAVAEHAVGLMLALNRKIHRAYNRVREGNFELEGLIGFDMHRRNVGVIGAGRIGAAVCRILRGFGCRVMVYDKYPDDELAKEFCFTDLKTLLIESEIITLHCPLTPETHHMIDAEAMELLPDGAMLINTSRGALIDTAAAIEGLKSGRLGSLGMDVYEEEGDLFFRDLSDRMIHDDVFARLLTSPNVIVTGHQGFFTREAMEAIAAATMENLSEFEQGRPLSRQVQPDLVA